jgi:hypothetical protein
MQMHVPPNAPSSNSGNGKNWNNERSRNQDMIINMYKEGGMNTKTDNKGDSVGDMNVNLDSVNNQDDMDGSFESGNTGFGKFLKGVGAVAKNQFGASVGDGELGDHTPEPERPRRRQQGRKVKEEPASYDRRDAKFRNTATLLERVNCDSTVASTPTPSSSSHSDSKGPSYSDRIMMAQQRSKRN